MISVDIESSEDCKKDMLETYCSKKQEYTFLLLQDSTYSMYVYVHILC